MAHQRLSAPGTHFRQFGILLDLSTPALVFGQVPVEHVEFMERHHVEVGLDLVDREEVAAAVEVRTAIGEGGLVFNDHAGKLLSALGLDLGERLLAPDKAGFGASGELDLSVLDLEDIFFGSQVRIDPCLDFRTGFGAAPSQLHAYRIGNDGQVVGYF